MSKKQKEEPTGGTGPQPANALTSLVPDSVRTPNRRGFLKLLGIGAAAGAAAGVVPGYLLGRTVRADAPATELNLYDDLIVLKPRASDPASLQAASLWFVDPDWRSSLDGSTVTQLENRTMRGVANGYTDLDSSALVPASRMGTGAPAGKFLKGDRTWTFPDFVDLTGALSDTQHGVRTGASAHRHADLAAIGTDDHHAKVHADAEHSLVYEKQSNKGIASGYAGLDAGALVPTAQLGSGAAGAGVFLRGDQTWGAPTAAAHNILSATHGDSVAASVARGDIIAGVGASPAWQRVAIGSSGKVLRSDGTDIAWTQLAHADLGSITADQHHAQLHKATHVSGGGDAFVKGDVLIVAPRYFEAVSDPASDSQRAWMNVGRIKFWSNEGTPVKHSLANLDDDLATFTGSVFATPAIVLGSAAAAGAAGTVIRSDSTIAAFDATVPSTSAVGDAAAVGSAAFAARRDHVHGREAFVAPSIALGSSAVAGSATTHIRSDSTIAAFDATVPTTSALADAAAVGSINFAARRDHRHGRESFATNAILLGSAAAAGVATTPFRSDDTIAAFDATVPTTSAMGDAAAVGTIAFAARRDHKHGRESFATPAIVLGSAAAAGSATTPIRSDGTIAAFDATVPSTSAVGDVAAVGTIAFAARRDHLHGREAFATPVKVTPAALSAAGSATTVSRSDHAHQSPGGVARIVADAAIANTETAVVTWTPGANFLVAGTTIRITGMGTLTTGATPGSVVFNIRCGTNATTGTVASTLTFAAAASQTNVGFYFEAMLTVRTTGAGGTCIAEITTWSQIGFPSPFLRNSATTATAVVDTTSASTVLSLSMISGNAGSTYTWKVAAIDVIHMG